MKLATLIALATSLTTATAQDTDQFGGSLATTREATGFFRTEQINDRWFFITPEGHPFIALGANHVGSFLAKPEQSSPLLKRFADNPNRAADALLDSLRDLGLNTGDAYQPVKNHANRWPWIHAVRYLPPPGKYQLDVFDPAQMQAMHDHVKTQAATVASNPWVIGIAGRDLPDWSTRRADYYKNLPPDSPGHRAHTDFFAENPDATDDDFAAHVAAKFFPALRAACKAGAPNHLFLGERTQLRDIPDPTLKVMGQHADVFCTQALIRSPQRPPEWQKFQRDGYDHEFALTSKPTLIIDWAAPFNRGAALRTDHGVIKTEPASASDAATFVREAFQPPYIIGLHICQVIGTHPNDQWFKPRGQRTYLQNTGHPWPNRARRLATANREILKTLYQQAANQPPP